MIKITPKKLFLIDGLGAVTSAFMLGFVLVKFQVFIGLPKNTLYTLSIIPCFFILYSFYCFYKLPKNWKFYLKIIAILNVLYCLLTISLVTIHFEKITFLGISYFILEIIVIGILTSIELKNSNKKVS